MSSSNDKDVQKHVNLLRFSWFENVSADPKLRKSGNALAMAAYVFRRFRADRGTAEFSIDGAARDLKMPLRSAARARRDLEKRGWIRKVKGPRSQRKGWSANVYILTGGPDDLELAEHHPAGGGDTDADVSDGGGSDTGDSSSKGT